MLEGPPYERLTDWSMNLTERALLTPATSARSEHALQQSRPIAVPVSVARGGSGVEGGQIGKTELYSESLQEGHLPFVPGEIRLVANHKNTYQPWSSIAASATSTGLDALEAAESPKTTSSTSNGSERDWRRSLLAESDPIHKESGRSRSRDTQGQRASISAGAPAARTYDTDTAVQHRNGLSQQHQNSLTEQLSSIESSSPSSVASFPVTNSIASLGNPEPRINPDNGTTLEANDTAIARLRGSGDTRLPLSSSPSRGWHDTDSGSPMRSTAGVWSPQNAATMGSGDSFDGTRRSRPTRSVSVMSDWNAPSRRSLSSTGVNNDHDNTGRPPIVHRALSINTAALSHVTGVQQTFSPSSWQSGSPEGNSSSQVHHTTSSPRPGLGRLPEGEEAINEGGSDFFTQATATPFYVHQQQQPGQRHRSTSSAAALQGMAGNVLDRDHMGLPIYDQHSRSASVWGTGPLSAELAGSPGSFAFFNQRPAAAPSPTLSRILRSENNERGRSTNQRDVTASSNEHLFHTGMPASAAHATTFTLDDAPHSGTESRRHSMMAAPPTVAGQQRRAIGFEVSRPIPGSRTSSVGRTVGSHPRTGFGMFGGGTSAISDDDLATDFDALRINLDETARQQQNQRVQQTATMSVGARVNAVDAAGVHSASMPPGYKGYSSGSPHRGFTNWPISARPRDDDEASIWSDRNLPSSPPQPLGVRSSVQQPAVQPDHRAGQPHGLSARAHSFQQVGPAPPGQQQQQQQSHGPTVNGSSGKRGSVSNTSAIFEPFGTMVNTFSSTGLTTIDKPTLSDHAIASLATLGPLAPPSGGGGPGAHDGGSGASGLQDLGKGVPLQMLPRDTPLYIVEFKQGRTDLYFRQAQSATSATARDLDEVRKGDLVIVEADRGKDLGSVINDTITVEQVQTFLAQQAELAQLAAAGAQPDGMHPAAVTLGRLTRSVNPKRLFAKAGPADTSLLHAKAQDEERALTLCTTKVNQRGLPMAVVAAEMQWDRRKLTFYYTATQRVDFRDLVKELFRLYKTRIWMCHLSHPSNGGTAATGTSA